MCPLNNRKTASTTLNRRLLLPQDSNATTMRLTTPQFKINAPMGAQVGTKYIRYLHKLGVAMKMTLALCRVPCAVLRQAQDL